jgi:type VI protein secretion system component VasK
MSKPFTVQYAGPISLAVSLAGVAMVAVGVLDLLGYRFKTVGTWGYWILAIGAILLLIGVIWFWIYAANKRKFKKLMEEQSKAAFVKNLDDVEYLAWRLPMKFEERLLEKKKQFGIR